MFIDRFSEAARLIKRQFKAVFEAILQFQKKAHVVQFANMIKSALI